MSIRNLTLVMLVLVTGSATGCGGMRNFLFGRGARCGLTSRVGAVGNALNPLVPAPLTTVAPSRPGCSLFNRNTAPVFAPPVACAPTCNDGCGGGGFVGSSVVSGGCSSGNCSSGHSFDGGYVVGTSGGCESCNSSGGFHQGVVSDPYLGSPVYGSPVIGSEFPVDGNFQGGSFQGGGIPGDNFYNRNYSSRKFDSRGDEIISESPLPPGAQILN